MPVSFMGRHRVSQFIRATIAAGGLGVVLSFLFDDSETTMVLCGLEVSLVGAMCLNQQGRTGLATWLMVLAISMLMGFQAYSSGGLRDEVVLAFPCLLIFASMFGTRWHYLAVLGIVLALLGLITIGNLTGWHVNHTQPSSGLAFVYITCILLVTAYFIWMMASDLRRMISQLQLENLRLAESHAQIDRLAHHDVLTGLPNRLLARHRLDQAIVLAQRHDHGVALMFLDLDNFKRVNDSLGHSTADRLLSGVGMRLAELVRSSDTVSRQGGDEFLVVLTGVTSRDDVAHMAERIIEHLARPIPVEDHELQVTCSLGIALFPEHATDFDGLLKCADAAMYRAKDAGRNSYRFHEGTAAGSA